MVRWLEEQGEIRGRLGAVDTPDYDALPRDVARIVSTIMQPYTIGAKGRCVLGLLLRYLYALLCNGGLYLCAGGFAAVPLEAEFLSPI